jgi:threonine dehydrogenase-like Zn-dependent dehydrogenase
MKRSRSQVSQEMSPRANEEGFLHKLHENEVFGLEATNGARREDSSSHVIVAGAGPAGLMLA